MKSQYDICLIRIITSTTKTNLSGFVWNMLWYIEFIAKYVTGNMTDQLKITK